MDKSVPICIVDAFTDVPFSGNQAAVCLIGKENLPDKLLQAVASEMNLAETSFVISKNNDYKEDQRFDLRWFTPTNEVPLCGHATLASAAVLFEFAQNKHSSVTFSTLSGDLIATKGENGFVNMDLPLNVPAKVEDIKILQSYNSMCEAVLGSESVGIVEEIWLSDRAKKLVFKMKSCFSLDQLLGVKPDFDKMLSLHDGSVYKGIIVTTDNLKSSKYDFLSRYFAPWNGIPEDHVTGSAHTVLAPLWGKKTGKTEMLGRQCSRRGGDVKVKLRENGRVDVGGKAALVLKGHIDIPR